MALKAVLCALALAGIWTSAAAGPAAEHVNIPGHDVTLHATLYRPQGAGPFPALVALHDCGGLHPRRGATSQLYGPWAERLVGNGFIVLFPDLFGSRGLDLQCRVRDRKVRASRQRVGDAEAARHWLQMQSFVQGDHVSLLGWSSGATATLWAVRPNAVPHDGGPDFRSAVAFYPACGRLHQTAWSARIPTLVLIGSADDWTAAAPCRQMVKDARGRSARAEIVVYPGAHHQFDRFDTPLRARTGLVNTVDPAGTAHRGTDPTARNDALKRVPQWLAR